MLSKLKKSNVLESACVKNGFKMNMESIFLMWAENQMFLRWPGRGARAVDDGSASRRSIACRHAVDR
jgi:hypothetical protein